MTLSLYAATVPSYQQILGAVAGLLTAAENFCSEKGISHAEIIEARLAQDMHPPWLPGKVDRRAPPARGSRH